ncbi:anaerobic ribonucleoside-triphosphate reductase activating protein [archaeon]|nr:anaerobic ribonucleoside-triphosphate reductase activating protein [archaeon]
MVQIKGFEKLTLVDYPDKIAATIFMPGCNFRCDYCHNPELVLKSHKLKTINEKEILDYLDSKKKWIDGVCITGGEPTLQKDLPEFIKKIKKQNILVKLDTNGTNSKMLKSLIDKKLLDYIAMDIKAPIEKYNQVTGVTADTDTIKKSINLIKTSNIDHEFRTTVCPNTFNEKDMHSIGNLIANGKKYTLQGFKPSKHINESMKNTPQTEQKELKKLAKTANKYIKCDIR